MRLDGTLRTWNDDRGFGFIRPAHGGQDIFVHIKAFPPGSGRPVQGQALSFLVDTGPDGRKRARGVQYPVRVSRRAARVDAPARLTTARTLAIPLLLALAWAVSLRWSLKPAVVPLYVGASLVAFLVYALDKSAAVGRRWRTPESTLHLLGLVGGWPGALLAQQLLRHKTSKPGFVATFWATVLLNLAGFVLVHAGPGAVVRRLAD